MVPRRAAGEGGWEGGCPALRLRVPVSRPVLPLTPLPSPPSAVPPLWPLPLSLRAFHTPLPLSSSLSPPPLLSVPPGLPPSPVYFPLPSQQRFEFGALPLPPPPPAQLRACEAAAAGAPRGAAGPAARRSPPCGRGEGRPLGPARGRGERATSPPFPSPAAAGRGRGGRRGEAPWPRCPGRFSILRGKKGRRPSATCFYYYLGTRTNAGRW